MSLDLNQSAARIFWYTQQEAAVQVLRIAEGTLSRYVNLGIAPQSRKIGNGRRFRSDWLQEWMLEGGVARADRAAILKQANAEARKRRANKVTSFQAA
jgi:helix-turn-helix protein